MNSTQGFLTGCSKHKGPRRKFASAGARGFCVGLGRLAEFSPILFIVYCFLFSISLGNSLEIVENW
jgi:hypothetical protein